MQKVIRRFLTLDGNMSKSECDTQQINCPLLQKAIKEANEKLYQSLTPVPGSVTAPVGAIMESYAQGRSVCEGCGKTVRIEKSFGVDYATPKKGMGQFHTKVYNQYTGRQTVYVSGDRCKNEEQPVSLLSKALAHFRQ